MDKDPKAEEVIFEIKKVISAKSWQEIVFCGFGEPMAKLDVLVEISRWLKSAYPLMPIRVDTNGHGYSLNPGRDVAEELKEVGVSRVSVSLNGQNSATYDENCRPIFEGGFESVLHFVMKANSVGLQVEVTAVRMPEVDVQAVGKVVEKLGVPFRVRDYIPCFW
jgi:cyclic pyranopterin phosphate synthase